jgi:hypothetical protein
VKRRGGRAEKSCALAKFPVEILSLVSITAADVPDIDTYFLGCIDRKEFVTPRPPSLSACKSSFKSISDLPIIALSLARIANEL